MTLWFAAWTAHNLPNFRPVSNDEVELMQVGYQLATRGVLGSDMYAGFFGADTHHLWTLPLQHVLDAISFRLFGVGVAQARWVSLVAAVSIVWTTSWLTLRRYGLATALACEVLLLVWRSDLTGGATGLPLLDVARVARYDVLAVAFAWLALAAVEFARPRWRRTGAVVSGVGAGLAALSQFFGAFVFVVLLVRGMWCGRNMRWLLAGFGVTLAPWLVYVGRFATDLSAQLSVYGARGDFFRPTFYVENVLSELSRYGELAAAWVVVFGVCVAVAYLAHDRLLLLTLVVPGVLLTLLDHTKTPLYAIALVPSICMALAVAWRSFVRFRFQLAGPLLTVVLGALVLVDGANAYGMDRLESGLVSSYLGVGQELQAQVTPGGLLLGPERWWWALHDHRYVSLRALWFAWTPGTRFADLAQRWQPSEVVVNNNVRGDVLAFPPALQREFWEYIAQCTTFVGEVDDATYFDTQIYRVTGC